MRTRIAGCLCALSVAALGRPARALDGGGFIGLGYGREDTFSPSLQTSRYDLSLGLNARGVLLSRNFLTYSGGFGYARVIADANGGESARDTLDYRLNSRMFGSYFSPVTLSFQASQREEDFSGSGNGYSSLSRTYGAGLQFKMPGGRRLDASYDRMVSSSRTEVAGETERRTHTYGGAINQGSSNFSYGARYTGTQSDGTFPGDAYSDHRVDVDAKLDVAPDVDFRVANGFYRRAPAGSLEFNPEQQSNAFQAAIRYLPPGRWTHQVGYSYSHGQQTVLNAPEIERFAHSLGYSTERGLGGEWRLRGTIDGSLAEDRVDGSAAVSTGETLGASAFWSRNLDERSFELRGGPSVALLQPAGEPMVWGYGVAAGGGYRQPSLAGLQVSYDIGYSQDTFANRGWRFRQALTASVGGVLGGAAVSGNVTASAERLQSPTLGAGGARSLAAMGTWSRNSVQLQLAAMMNDGLANPVRSGGDGLFLALPYDTRSYHLTLTASAVPLANLSLSGDLRWSSIQLPDRPNRDELQAIARARYAIGALFVGLEERYVDLMSDGARLRANQILVTAGRGFAFHF